MVELRNAILDDLDRLYFERKRLGVKLSGIKDTQDAALLDEAMLKIDELTSRIDGLTNGCLSNPAR